MLEIIIMISSAAYLTILFFYFYVEFTKKPLITPQQYFCYCDMCENHFQLSIPGKICPECGDGIMNPQNIDPW